MEEHFDKHFKGYTDKLDLSKSHSSSDGLPLSWKVKFTESELWQFAYQKYFLKSPLFGLIFYWTFSKVEILACKANTKT